MLPNVSVILSAVIVGVYTSCIALHCPSTDIALASTCIDCTICHQSRFCGIVSNRTCQCSQSIPSTCSRTPVSNSALMTYCSWTEDIPIPAPQIHRDGNSAVSVIVPRFFTEHELENRNLSNLLLVAHFFSPAPTACRDVHAIQAQKRGDSECMLRVKLAIPGVDHKTDDHYYYDDGSPIETSFSIEMFEGADQAVFWNEITVQQIEYTSRDQLIFFSRVRSLPVRHIFHATPLLSPSSNPNKQK